MSSASIGSLDLRFSALAASPNCNLNFNFISVQFYLESADFNIQRAVELRPTPPRRDSYSAAAVEPRAPLTRRAPRHPSCVISRSSFTCRSARAAAASAARSAARRAAG